MPFPWIGLALGLVAGIANVAGGWVVARGPLHIVYLRYFIALGSGFMLATALLEMLPESFTLLGPSAAGWMLGGYLLVHFFEHTASGHFHFGEETHAEEVAHVPRTRTVLFGLMVHAFVDGVAIASGFLISHFLGWVVFLAVFLHKMPEGFTVSSIMLASGQGRRAAMTAAVLLGAATVLGVLVMLPLRGQVLYTLPISAGVALYVAASDLIPEVNREPGIRVALMVFVGVVLMLLMERIFGM